MIHFIRTSRFSKVVASYLALQLMLTTVQPSQLFALTGGPSQPEFNTFTPIGTSDMVNLTSGDFNYNIPIMDVGGYPLNLAYNSGITMDQEASWVGLGWNLNVGQIARSVRGLPDDFKGDPVRYENDASTNTTIGINANFPFSFLGGDGPSILEEALGGNVGLDVQYNTFSGFTVTPSTGVSYKINENMSAGIDISSNVESGPTIRPRVSFSQQTKAEENKSVYEMGSGVGVGFNSRQGLQNLNLSFDVDKLKSSGSKLNNQNLSGGILFNDQHYSPRKRAGLSTNSFTFNVSGAPTFFGLQPIQVQLTGYGSYQDVKESEKDKEVAGYGYQHTESAQSNSLETVLDINRENDRTVNKHTTLLSVPNYTYDMYAIQGQGIGGSFRPYRGQISYLYDGRVTDNTDSGTFGIELGAGNISYNGFEVKLTDGQSISQAWEDKNFTLPRFTENEQDDNPIDFEKTYFKTYGGFDVDSDISLYTQNLLGDIPIRLKIGGSTYNRDLLPVFEGKQTSSNAGPTVAINSKLERTKRHARNQSIHSVDNATATYDQFIEHREEAFAKAHHTVGMKVMKPDGSTYVYGEAAYNTKKVEATFDVSKRRTTANYQNGMVSYNPDLKSNRSSGSDGFLNRITTPAYAHSYLLSSVLSSDYEDITGNGPTDDDLGAYTKFTYNTYDDNYKWRIPFSKNKASYNEGLKSNTRDEKGNYVYGEKELKYIQKIETKTHVAIFKLSERNDGRGVRGESGGIASTNEGRMQKLDKIYLFSKPEYTHEFSSKLENDDPSDDPSEDDLMRATIKIAHFEYEGYGENGIYNPADADKELCKGIFNASSNGGKLTLSKVYFTYRGSYMGKHTPYTFNYADFDGDGIMEANPDYNMKGYDAWGCYKPNEGVSSAITSPLTTSEYPFVEQDKELADNYTRSWCLSSIDMPSGGKMEVQLEADDYQYVQERQAMQMFKVVGAGNSPGENGNVPDGFISLTAGQITNSDLYNDEDGHYKYLYVKLSDEEIAPITEGQPFDGEDFRNTYLKDYEDKPIFFRFLLNMDKNTSSLYDYVEGYFQIDQSRIQHINVFQNQISDATYVAIPMEYLSLEGITTNNQSVNPISKAGWYFGRTYLNKLVYGSGSDLDTDNFEEVVESIYDSFEALVELFTGPNKALEREGIAKDFIRNKSWIRLLHPTGAKLGGGCRVAKIQLHDEWDAMVGAADNPIYKQFYGQEYDYDLEDNTSSGVATFEPNSSKENPYVEPFYSEASQDYSDKISAPKESNYVEKPIGASFFPSPEITYSRVTVKNLQRERTDAQNNALVVKKHATGKVVTEHFTSKDFPTISSFTALNPVKDPASAISQLFKFSVKNHLTMSQGFVVETNDMNGKVKRQEVFAEDKESPISGVEYKYSTQPDNAKRLNNVKTTINDLGEVSESLIGMDYEVINDFRENKTNTVTGGVNANLSNFFVGILISAPFPLPTLAKHETQLRTAATMKHIHKSGIMTEKIAYDLGSKVSTKYIAWDEDTGQALLTKTINEYDDNYFNFTYPVHWYDDYKGMGRASQNISMEGKFQSISGNHGYFKLESLTNTQDLPANNHLIEGDEVLLQTDDNPNFNTATYWVAGFSNNGNDVMLMDRAGKILNECGDEDGLYTFKVTRSGFRNQQSASMASVTSMINPIDINNDGTTNNLTSSSFEFATGNANNPRIINASAIEYKDFWLPQDEYRLARFFIENGNIDNTVQHANPYVYNVKAEWRALKSYAFLTGRNFNTDAAAAGASPRHEGFFDSFQPFYQLATNGNSWEIHPEDWTFASEVSQYSPYGAELENMDALQRFSSAQYGYNYTLPTAVASNTKYRELGFDGFEDYTYTTGSSLPLGFGPINHHFSFADDLSNPNAGRTQGKSHTGRYSIVVNGEGNELTLTRPLENPAIGPRETCPVIPPDLGEPICNASAEPHPQVDPCASVFYVNWFLNGGGPGNATEPLNFGPDGPASSNPVVITNVSVPGVPSEVAEAVNVFTVVNPSNFEGSFFQISLFNGQIAQSLYGHNIFVNYTMTDSTGDSINCTSKIVPSIPTGCPTAQCINNTSQCN